MDEPAQRCGLIAIVGRPNVGKSTLLNALVGQKISITSAKAQTTRHRITGVCTVGAAQFVFVDTPGFQTRHGAALNRTLNRTVQGVLADVDVVLFVVEAGRFTPEDRTFLASIPREQKVIAVVNKVDLARKPTELIPYLDRLARERDFDAVVPVSAKSGRNLPELLRVLRGQLEASDSSAVDTLERIRQALDGAPKPRSFRELVQLVDAFSFDAALAKLEQARADLGLETRAA